MGVKFFFVYIKNNFPQHIKEIKHKQTYESIGKVTDNLLIDMNGVFHNSAQRVYEYGNFKKPPSLLRPKKPVNKKHQELRFFQDVCSTIEDLIFTTKPKKRVIMCVDGPAPTAKMQQQRSRRFKGINDDTSDSPFDTSSISVGTKLMDNLSKYIDWFIRKKISSDTIWQNLEIVYSSYKVSGEGEQSLLAYIRKYGTDEETYTIHGLDADIIMLALVSHRPNFFVIREDLYNNENKFLNVDINGIRQELTKIMTFEHSNCNSRSIINDFVFLLYLAGNDFLPHIPSIEILENGIDIMIDVYKNVCKEYGHLTTICPDGKVKFVPKTLETFLGTIAQYEKGMLEAKMDKKQSFFPDLLLEKHCKFIHSKNILDIDNYRKNYLHSKFPPETSEQQICLDYLEGLQWVLTYYTTGIPDWNWHYKFFYAPFASHLSNHVKSFTFKTYGFSQPLTPFQQLLCITPPKSGYLLPSPLNQLLTNEESPIKQKYCPDRIELDLSGKRKEWEAIVLVPMIDRQLVKQEYFKLIDKVDPKDLSRNIPGKIFSYKHDNTKLPSIFKSYYGDIPNCTVQTSVVHL
jgi:5'-3' exonuclease